MKFALSLGGNIGDVENRFDMVEKALADAGVTELRRSRVYVTLRIRLLRVSTKALRKSFLLCFRILNASAGALFFTQVRSPALLTAI